MKRYRKESVHQGRQKAFDKKLALYLICKIGKYKNKKSPLQWNIILGGVPRRGHGLYYHGAYACIVAWNFFEWRNFQIRIKTDKSCCWYKSILKFKETHKQDQIRVDSDSIPQDGVSRCLKQSAAAGCRTCVMQAISFLFLLFSSCTWCQQHTVWRQGGVLTMNFARPHREGGSAEYKYHACWKYLLIDKDNQP